MSRLEGGSRKPTLELLLPLAEVYAVPLDHLVGAPRTGAPGIHLRPVTRGGVTLVPLSDSGGAFREVGRVIRTVQLLRCLSDAPLRQRVTAATDKVEAYDRCPWRLARRLSSALVDECGQAVQDAL
ncbi:hypothetical protein GCM10027091_57240 [Streptomyces daliensis]